MFRPAGRCRRERCPQLPTARVPAYVTAMDHDATNEVRPQNTADSESEDRNAAACLVKDSGYWKSEPCPASGYASNAAFGRFSANQYELRTGIISSWKPCTTSVR